MEYSQIEKFYSNDAYCGFADNFNVERYSEYTEYVKKHIGSGRVYEIGSGLGQAACALYRNGINVTATDIFPHNAKKSFEKNNLSIPVELLNVNQIEKDESSIENYTLYQVLEHIETPEQAIKEIHRTLAPGGKFVIVGPNLISPISNLKCLIMALIGKWKTPLFKRRDGYSFPFGDTIIQIGLMLFLNSWRTSLRVLCRSCRTPLYRKPSYQKPAISDSDSVFLMNPMDVRSILERVGFEILDYQTKRKLSVLSGSTWIVAQKK